MYHFTRSRRAERPLFLHRLKYSLGKTAGHDKSVDLWKCGKSILAYFNFRVPTGARDVEPETFEDQLPVFRAIAEF